MVMKHFFTNALATSMTRHETFEGRDHIVVPVVALVAGVVNGELALAEEIAASLPAWDGVPFTVNHPVDAKGQAISANSPKVLEATAIGRTFNMEFVDDRLKGEIWIDVEKAKSLGGEALQILERVEAGEALEVSTGYFRDVEAGTGEFSGIPYDGIQRNLRPNHLAGLPNDIGACSWDNGCGAPRINAKGKTMKDHVRGAIATLAAVFGLQTNQDLVSAGDVRSTIYGLLTKELDDRRAAGMPYRYAYIQDVFETYFIYEVDGRYFKRAYAVAEDGKITLGDDVGEVQRKTDYIAINGPVPPLAVNNTKEVPGTMTKADKINLIINCGRNPFTEAERGALESMSEAVLDQIMAPPVPAAPAPAANTAQPAPATNMTTASAPAPSAPAIPEGMSLVSNEQKALLDRMLAANAQRKADAVAKLAANERCKLSKATLETLSQEDLDALEQTLAPADYSGRGLPSLTGNADLQIPAPPSIVGAAPAA